MALPFSPRISDVFTLSVGQTGPMTQNWKLFAAADLGVYRLRAGVVSLRELNTDYSVAGVGEDAGFSVTLLAGATEGDKYVLVGARPVARTSTITSERGATPTFLNKDLDQTFAQVQEIARDVARAFKTDLFDPDVFDFEDRRLRNVGDPVDPGDAVNLGSIQAELDAATAAATATAVAAAGTATAAAGAASAAQSAAETAQGTAETAAGAAAGAAVAAGNAQTAAEAAAAAASNKLPKDGSEAMTGPLLLTGASAPSTPAAGLLALYAKTDKKLYVKDDAGAETEVGAGGGSSIFYNAVADGGVDNTGATSVATSLAAAITAAAAAFLILYIPPGTYDCADAKFTLGDKAAVLCAPGAELRRTADPGSPGPLFEVGNDVQWQGGRLKSTLGAAVVDGNNCAIRAQTKTGVSVENLYIEGLFYVGLVFETATDCQARGCYVRGVKNRAFYVYQDCDDVTFSQCTANGYNVGGTTRTTDYGFNINPANVSTSRQCRNIRVVNCSVEHCGSQGIEFGDRTYSSIIAGCTIEDIGSYGILVQKANGELPLRNTVTGNAVSNCGSHGIYLVEAYYCSVAGNSCYGNGGDGIRSAGAQYSPITGNNCIANTGNGIGIGSNGGNSSVRCAVTGNVCTSNTDRGVRLDAGSLNNLVFGNIIQGNTGGQLTDGATGTVTTSGNVTT